MIIVALDRSYNNGRNIYNPEALQHFDAAHERLSDDFHYLTDFADFCIANNRLARARDLLEAASHIAPHSFKVQALSFEYFYKDGVYAEAARYGEAALAHPYCTQKYADKIAERLQACKSTSSPVTPSPVLASNIYVL